MAEMTDLTDLVDLCGVHPKWSMSLSMSLSISLVVNKLNAQTDEFWTRKGPGFNFVNRYLFVRGVSDSSNVYFYETPEGKVAVSDVIRALLWLNKK